MKDLKLKEAQKKEIEYWKNSDLERSGVKYLPCAAMILFAKS